VSARELITEHLDLWTGAVTKKSSSGRGSNGKVELTGVKKLREFILELALRGKLTDQLLTDEPAREFLARAKIEREALGQGPGTRNRPGISPVDTKPFAIPESWSWERLGDIGLIASSRRVRQRDWQDKGIPFYRAREVVKLSQQGYVNNELFISEDLFSELAENGHIPEANDLMLTGVGTIGVPYIVKQDDRFYFKDASVLIFKNFFGVCPQFLYYFCHSPFWKQSIHEDSMGTTVHTLTIVRANQALIPFPPIEEQHRIVQKVDELMALCDRLEQQTSHQLEAHETLVDTLLGTLTQSENATELADNWARLAAHFDTLFTTEQSIDKLMQTILQLAVMGRLVEQDAGDEPATELLNRIQAGKDHLSQSSKQRKAKPLPPISELEEPFSLPSGWALSRLDDITDIQGGIAKGKKVTGKKTRTLPYLRVANVQRSSLDLSEIKEIEIAEDEVERYLVRERDLLITEGGDWDKVGRTSIWDGRIEPMAHQNHVFRARLILKEQNERWLERYLNSQFARDYFASSSKQTTNLASINKTQLRSCTVPLPPLAEQYRIVQKVDELMALCDQLKERLNQASETRCHLAKAVVEKALN